MVDSAGTKPLSVTVKKARELTGLGHTKLYELIKQQKLKAVLVGCRRLILFESLQSLLKLEGGRSCRGRRSAPRDPPG
jgi:excisionase family DNA binding protein